MSGRRPGLPKATRRPDLAAACNRIREAQRLIRLCAAATDSQFQDAQEEIQETLGIDVDSMLDEAIEAIVPGSIARAGVGEQAIPPKTRPPEEVDTA